jgi:hypothetical protein
MILVVCRWVLEVEMMVKVAIKPPVFSNRTVPVRTAARFQLGILSGQRALLEVSTSKKGPTSTTTSAS